MSDSTSSEDLSLEEEGFEYPVHASSVDPDGAALQVGDDLPADVERGAGPEAPGFAPAGEGGRVHRSLLWRLAALVLLSAAVGGAVGAAVVVTGAADPEAPPAVTIVERVETRFVEGVASEADAAAVAQRVVPSIVTVEIDRIGGEEFIPSGSGSGVVIDAQGHLVTNHHVVDQAQRVRVVFANGLIYEASVVGSDPLTDLAVLSIEATDLTPIELGSSASLAVGDPAIAVGSPLGLEGGPSVTTGVVSAFDREVGVGNRRLFGMLQTDAPITRGSSGGALVDRHGRLIGITTAIGVSDVGAEGLGFAIPVETVARISADLIAHGTAAHPFLGIQGVTFFEGNPDGSLRPAGVSVDEIIENTAAAMADLLPGDVIVSVDGAPVATLQQLVAGLRAHRVGDSVALGVRRRAETFTILVELMERPEGM